MMQYESRWPSKIRKEERKSGRKSIAEKAKDEGALGWFIDHYTAYVNTIIYNLIGQTASALDMEAISSDVFFTLWNNAGRIQSGKVKAYLGAVARNKAKEHVRKLGREVPLEEDIIIDSGENVEREFTIREQAKFIRETVLALPQPEREIFLRHYYYYQPVAVIAEEMGINISTIKTKLHRGRKILKASIVKGGFCIEDENF